MSRTTLNLALFISFFTFMLISCDTEKQDNTDSMLDYPKTTKVDTIDEYFGVEVVDPYRWLEDDRSEETAEWVAAQNVITFNYLESIDYRDQIKNRLKKLLDYEKVGAPFIEGDYEYWYKNDGLQNHSVVYRKEKGSESEGEVFLDPNSFSEDGTVALRGMSFTEDGSLVAYMITEGGSDWRKAIVMDTKSKTIIEDTLKNIKFSGISWKGNEGFYYSSYDQPKAGSDLSGKTQYHKLYFHKLKSDQIDDELIFGGEAQPNRYVGGIMTENDQYLVVSAAQNTSGNRLYVKDMTKEDAEFVLIQDDYMQTASVVETWDDKLLVYTNIDAPMYKVVAVDPKSPEKGKWKEIIPESENVLTASAGGGKLFASYLEDAKTVVYQHELDGTKQWEIELPGLGTAGGFWASLKDSILYYSYTSFNTPSSIYKYHIESGNSDLYKKPEVDFDPELYETKQVFYTSKDGTKVPMFIVHKKGIELNGKNPTIMHGYGGFNSSQRPNFSASRLIWLENGGIYAQPNLRGGGEYGEEWHLAGTKMNKQNVFDDFIAAAEFLIDNKYTSSEYLAISGGSNGGLLVGATMTQRPDLMKVALPAVGVLDMLRYHEFTAGAGWASDYGTADDSKEMFEYLRNYSPYHALKEGTSYPATLVTTSDHDDRVVPAHSFKFAARLQEYHKGKNPVLIRVQTNAGHGSVSLEQQIEYTADRYAFTWYNMGIIPDLAKGDM